MDPDETTIELRDPGTNGRHNGSQPKSKSNSNSYQDPYDPQAQIRKLFRNYWEKSSISGISFITTSKYSVVRIIWLSLLIVASVALTVHLVHLSMQYFSYKKQSKIDLEFKNLRLPAVTICNANPIRASLLDKTSPQLQRLVKIFNPVVLTQIVRNWQVAYPKPFSYSFSTNTSEDDAPRSGNFLDDFDVSDFLEDLNQSPPAITQNGTDETGEVTTPTPTGKEEEDFEEMYPNSWEAESKPSSFEFILNTINNMYSEEPASVRQRIGHKIEDMLLQCSFRGRKCSQSSFTRDVSIAYGNCYTLDNEKFIARRSGPKGGLELIFFLELDEYIRGVALSEGLQVVIHEPGTLPLPDEEGIAVMAGTNTYVGLKMTEILRLGQPHGICTSNDNMYKKYGVRYTRQICQKICYLEHVWEKCGCFDSSALLLKRLNLLPTEVRSCLSKTDKNCLRTVRHGFEQISKRMCDCENPCREKVYRKIVSSRQWPNTDFAKLLVETICQQGSFGHCEVLRNKSDEDLSKEFVKLNIFYEDLNYERLEENPDYEITQFLSDIGGTIGLWIGLSLLSLFEILHLVVHVVIEYCFPRWKRSFARKYKYKDDES